MNLTRQLCDYLAAITPAQIGEENMTDIRYKLLDWLGCCIAAKDRPAPVKAAAILRQQSGSPHCTAIGISGLYPTHEAAFYNALLAHTLEYDDTNKIAVAHPGAPVVAAALAVAQADNADFETFACGVAAGYEAMIRLGAAIGPSHSNIWHATGTCGVFAAAAAAGRIRGLSGAQLETAFGIASTMASGLVNVFGTETKLITVGNAARNGIVAAEFAQMGFTAPEDGFASAKGYAATANGKEDLQFMAPASGDRLYVEDAYYKMHASCGHTHSALDALQALLNTEPVRPEEIVSVKVHTYALAKQLCSEQKVSVETKAKFSLPYCIATMLRFGRVTLTEFTPERLADAETQRLAGLVTVEEDPEITKGYPVLRTGRVTITCADGRVLENEVDLPVGHPAHNFLEQKFHSLCTMTVSPEKSTAVCEAVLSLKDKDPVNNLSRVLSSVAE